MDLNGWYDYDDEGVKAQPVTAVDKGVLKTFLMSRSPIQGLRSFQRARPAAARAGGGFAPVEPDRGIGQRGDRTPGCGRCCIGEVKKQNKPYGLYFRDITGGFTTTQRAGLQAFKVIPVIVYRVYADGRPDELVRGADIVGTPLASFAKILATSRQAGSLQRILRRGIGQRAGVGGVAGDTGFGNRNRKEGQVATTGRRCFPSPPSMESRREARSEAGAWLAAAAALGGG